MKGLSTFGQEPFTIKAFADDCVIRLFFKQDVLYFSKSLASFSNLSQAKINTDKSQAIVIGSPGFRPPMGIRPSNKPVKHLETWIQKGGFNTQTMGSNVLRSVTTALSMWQCDLVTQISRAQLVNTLGYSKVWFTAQFFPLLTQFFQSLNRIVQTTLWCPNIPPVTTAKLVVTSGRVVWDSRMSS